MPIFLYRDVTLRYAIFRTLRKLKKRRDTPTLVVGYGLMSAQAYVAYLLVNHLNMKKKLWWSSESFILTECHFEVYESEVTFEPIMEEVDRIIIESLKQIHCDIEENVLSVGDFTPDVIFTAIVYCLENIPPTVKFPRKLPQSMSLRLKTATNVADHIKELGYRNDMGYQTILYCNEHEIRKLFIFLIEKLPRDLNASTVSEDLGYVSKLVKEIEERIGACLDNPWVPTSFLEHGVRECENFNLKQDCGDCFALQTENVRIPDISQSSCSEAVRQYWIHNLPDVTKQCKSNNLIASLLFKDSEFSIPPLNLKDYLVSHAELSRMDVPVNDTVSPKENVKQTFTENESSLENEQKINLIMEEIKENKSKYKELKSKHNLVQAKLEELSEEKSSRESLLEEIKSKSTTKLKALQVISNEEKVSKLKNLVENGNKKLEELARQWKQVETTLQERYRELQQQETKVLTPQQKLQNLRDKNQLLAVELQEKVKVEAQILKEFEKINKNTHRSAYTKRILEIILNIKKQNDDIQKVLQDTKLVQKDINNLNGQVDRSFTLSDELIFRDAKREETARKSYKLLANLHSDFGEIIQAVTNLGLVERDARNIQEQIDAEMTRDVSTKLDQVNADLAEIKKETALLVRQLKEQK